MRKAEQCVKKRQIESLALLHCLSKISWYFHLRQILRRIRCRALYTLHSKYTRFCFHYLFLIYVNRIIVSQCIRFVRRSVRVKRSKRRSEGAAKEELCAFDANGQRILSMRPIGSHRNLTRCVARRGKTKRAGRMESQQDINIQDSCSLDKTADSSRASAESHGID